MPRNPNKNTSNVSRTAVWNKLKIGEIEAISQKTGYSRAHVSNLLAGRRNNASIMKAATTLTARRK
jgi:hypothetical protein